MKTTSLFYLFYASMAKPVYSVSCSETMEVVIDASATKLYFSGFNPTVTRFTNMGLGNKIVLKGYEKMPMIATEVGSMMVTAGEACSVEVKPEGESTSSASKILRFALPFLLGTSSGGIGSGIAFGIAGGLLGHAMVDAQTTAECELAPIEVDIYVDASSDEIVMRSVQSGDFEMCPPESLYWKHHPTIFGGFEGCVGEKTFYPCAQDGQGREDVSLLTTKPLFWNNETCVETGYTTENRTYWVIWGDPLDKHELNARTGFNPVVSFPFNRGPYPEYQPGVPPEIAIDDSATARAMAKDLLVYLGAFTEDALTEFHVSFTEGAEQGMIAIYAAKALEIASTTCTRDIYVLSEVPSYGYSNTDAAYMTNKYASEFLNETECPCFNTSSCKDPTVTITTVGWLPNTPLPTAIGFDGVEYAADSDSPNSPWFESLVFPENPSGRLKTPQLPIVNRRVCDGVYLWPMYFGANDYQIPTSEVPDCSAWSFSITKAYSASVRAGFLMFKSEPASNTAAFVKIVNELISTANGQYSEWSWYGQMQLWDMIMSRTLDDPTSWIGAYTEIMNEKWTVLIDAFEGCPVTTITNPKMGAYVWFRMNEAYLGIQGDDFISSFFKDVLGVSAPTYNWGFRGADPADFYGANYTINDFVRLQLYRDVTVYEEIARRAKIICSDMDATIGDYLSVNQWAASAATTARRRAEGFIDDEDRTRHLIEVIPGLTDRQLDYIVSSHVGQDKLTSQYASCAPEYSTTCFFQKIGTRFHDN